MYFFFIFIAVEVSIISFWFSLQLHNFKRHLAQLIGDLDDSIAAEEDAIVSKVKNVVRDYRDVKSVSALFTGEGGHAVIEAFNTRPNSAMQHKSVMNYMRILCYLCPGSLVLSTDRNNCIEFESLGFFSAVIG